MIKELILKYGQVKHKITDFVKTNQRVFYKEFSNFELIDDILYRQTEDQFGINQVQLVLQKQAV